ncbi:helix-turn-helix domain-containing protein [Streptomyces sp. CA-250714]|uniref:helix-turn-helix domain-containing protein n=1 Tax=Streptomyces sp. CA-250714 TaxID=3240060 RepID=UPI003D8BD974
MDTEMWTAGGEGWRMWAREPAPPLRYAVAAPYQGYREQRGAPLRRAELPWCGVTLILSFGDRIAVTPRVGSGRPAPPVPYESFVAGLFDRPVTTEHAGTQHGLEVQLSPAGAYGLFGIPPGAYANQVVRFEELAAAAPRGSGVTRTLAGLAERLAEAPSWAARFDLVDRTLGRLTVRGPAMAPEVARAAELLALTDGRTAVSELARATGWSRRHLSSRFTEQIGMGPKVYARVCRFRNALRMLEATAARPPGSTRSGGPADSLARIAEVCGYYDQAHLNRDFRELAGRAPTAHLSALADQGEPGAFPFVQDADRSGV